MDLFVFLLLSLSSLHNLDNSPLSDVSFAYIFPCGLFSHSSDIVFQRTEVLNFNEV